MSQRNAQNRRFDVETPEAEKQGFDDLKACVLRSSGAQLTVRSDYPPTFEGNDGKVIAHSLSLAAQDGKAVAFDAHGHALIEIDHAAERRLRWKIDLHIIPIVAIMYMWCFLVRCHRVAALTRSGSHQHRQRAHEQARGAAWHERLRLCGRSVEEDADGVDNVALSTFFVACSSYCLLSPLSLQTSSSRSQPR